MKLKGSSGRRRRSLRAIASSTARLLLAAVVMGSVLALGSVHIPVLLVVAAAATLCAALTIYAGSSVGASPFAWLPLGLLAFTLLQAIPLPFAWVQALSPHSADIWEGARQLTGAQVHSTTPLSLDPGATLVEALKLWTYFCVIVGAAAATTRRGTTWGALLLLGASFALAMVTIAHGLIDAHRVFGVYTPRLGGRGFRVAPLINPNNLAGYLNLGFAAGLSLLALDEKPLPRWLTALTLLPIAGMCVLTGSRAGVLGLAIAIVLAVWLLRPKADDAPRVREAFRRFTTVGGLVLGASILLAVAAARSRLWHLLMDDNVAKLDLAKASLPLIARHSWLGIGRGAFESVFPELHAASDNSIYSHPENFLIQWGAEWGLPVTALLLVGVAVCVRRGGFELGPSRVRRGLLAGICALVIQNLFDLGFEVPGVMIALAAAVGFAARAKQPEGNLPTRRASRIPRRIQVLGVVVGGLVLIALGARFGLRTLTIDRDTVREAIPKRADDDAQVAAARRAIRDAMARHPAEPYFPRLGALVAWRTKQNPMPWLDRALERGLSAGRTHYLLGVILASTGNRKQAMLAFRTAATLEPSLTRRLAQVVAELTNDVHDLVSAAPEGAAGQPFLSTLAGLLPREREDVAIYLIEEAIRRNPRQQRIRLRLVERLVVAITEGRVICAGSARERCVDRVRGELAHLRLQPEQPVDLAIWEARLLVVSGRAMEAQVVLAETCPRLPDRTACLRAWLEAVRATKDAASLTSLARAARLDGCGLEKTCTALVWESGVVALELGNVELALTQMEQAALQEGSVARWRRIAKEAQRNGLPARALRALDRASAIAPDDPSLLRDRAAVRQSMLRIIP